MISQEVIQQIKNTAKIADFVSQFVTIKNNEACCPFHEERTPSFKIPKNNQNFAKCFGCGWSGDAVDFVMKINGFNFFDSVKYVANFYNIEIEEDNKPIVKPVERLEKLDKKYIEWFENRGISNNTLLRFNITQSKEWMPKFKQETGVICFNYYRDGELVNIKFRGAQKDFKLNKDSELIFYNIDAIKNEKECIIVEGEVDCLSMYEANIYNVVSVPNGTTPTGNMRLQYLDNCYEYFTDKEKIIIATDNDEVGKKLKDELIRRLGKDRCYYVTFPDNCKDANDVLKLYGKDGIHNLIESAKPVPIDGIVESQSIENDILDFYRNGYPKGTKIGIEGIDDHLQLMEGQFTTVTGAPGHGKSEFIDYIMATMAIKSNWKWAICSFENTPASLHATKIAEKIAGKAFDYRIDPNNRMSKGDLDLIVPFIRSNFFFYNTNECDVTIDGIIEKASELVARKGINGLLIDPWNYIQHDIPIGTSETNYISNMLSKIKLAAMKLGIHIIIIAHPAKLQKIPGTKKYEIPTMYSISGSAHFNNKTDNGLCVYRDFETGVVEVYVQKVRYSWLGSLAGIQYKYNTFTRQYEYLG